MSIRVLADGIRIEVDTAEELQVVLSILRGGQRQMIKSQVVEESSLTDFYNAVDKTSNLHKLLVALREKPEGMLDEELREKLGLDSGNALGGLLGAVSKRARKAGLDFSNIIVRKEVPDESGDSDNHYRLSDEMKEIIPEPVE